MQRTISFTVNGESQSVTTDPERPLLDVLREDLGLTGCKFGCGERQCGACTVLVNGRPTFSCSTRVATANNRKIETIVRNTFPKNIRLVTQVDSRLGMVLGDPLQLNQALLNLCVNARDAMAAGGTLTLKVANATIDEPFAAMSGDVTPGHYVLINVTDTGEGIDGETLKRLFEPFFTTKTVGKGSGRITVSSLSGDINICTR